MSEQRNSGGAQTVTATERFSETRTTAVPVPTNEPSAVILAVAGFARILTEWKHPEAHSAMTATQPVVFIGF
jgi:hypothetical protein